MPRRRGIAGVHLWMKFNGQESIFLASLITKTNDLQRVDRIKSTLARDLDHLFSNTLNSLTTSEVELASITDKARWTSDLTECLKTYDALHSWEDAEEVVRRELVQPFVKSVSRPAFRPGER
jgi:hypothetical protein